MPDISFERHTLDNGLRIVIAPDRSAVIGYDDPESVALKTEWGMKLGLRGVFFWEINQDRLTDGTNPLQEAARKKFDERQQIGNQSR